MVAWRTRRLQPPCRLARLARDELVIFGGSFMNGNERIYWFAADDAWSTIYEQQAKTEAEARQRLRDHRVRGDLLCLGRKGGFE